VGKSSWGKGDPVGNSRQEPEMQETNKSADCETETKEIFAEGDMTSNNRKKSTWMIEAGWVPAKTSLGENAFQVKKERLRLKTGRFWIKLRS
jgi:hypothetical protein